MKKSFGNSREKPVITLSTGAAPPRAQMIYTSLAYCSPFLCLNSTEAVFSLTHLRSCFGHTNCSTQWENCLFTRSSSTPRWKGGKIKMNRKFGKGSAVWVITNLLIIVQVLNLWDTENWIPETRAIVTRIASVRSWCSSHGKKRRMVTELFYFVWNPEAQFCYREERRWAANISSMVSTSQTVRFKGLGGKKKAN